MKILNFGSLNIDHVYKVPHFVKKGETLSSEDLKQYPGGKGLNQSIALAKAGMSVWHAGVIGADGQLLSDILTAAGVHTELLHTDTKTPTGHAIIQNDVQGDNCILLYGGTNQQITTIYADEVLSHFGSGDYLVLQNEINQLSYIIINAKARGMKIILNPSPMDAKIFELPLHLIDLFFVNEIEAAGLIKSKLSDADISDNEKLASRLQELFPENDFVLTLGEEGSMYLSSDTQIYQPAFKIKAVDTTAAGDTFTGFFLSGLLHGKNIPASLELASKASAITCSRAGAAVSIPTMEEVK